MKNQVSAPLVFVGYGMEAPEFGLNDYEGLNVEGKIVVMLTGALSFYRVKKALTCLTLSLTSLAKKALSVLLPCIRRCAKKSQYETSVYYTKTPRMTWLGPNGLPKGQEQQISGSAYLDDEPAKRLFANAPTELEAIFTKIQKTRTFHQKVLN